MWLSPVRVILLSLPVLAVASPAAGQSDPVIAELDAFWAEVARTVSAGDAEGMRELYHPDGIYVFGSRESYLTQAQSSALDDANADLQATREGRRAQGIEFRLTSRVHDESTAHEVGLYHFWVTPQGEERSDHYGVVDSYLTKVGGRWMILVEIQTGESSKAEWDAGG